MRETEVQRGQVICLTSRGEAAQVQTWGIQSKGSSHSAELTLEKGGISAALLTQAPSSGPVRIWQVKANEEAYLALPCQFE